MTEPEAERPSVRLGLDEPSGTQRLLGFEIAAGGGGAGICRMEVGAAHLNRHGVMHGGLIATLLDTAMGAAASLQADPDGGTVPFTTITMSVQFQAPMRLGMLTATGRVTGGGRKTLFVTAEARDGSGTLIGSAMGSYKPVPGP